MQTAETVHLHFSFCQRPAAERLHFSAVTECVVVPAVPQEETLQMSCLLRHPSNQEGPL